MISTVRSMKNVLWQDVRMRLAALGTMGQHPYAKPALSINMVPNYVVQNRSTLAVGSKPEGGSD
jgi:hypothetical protein